MYTQLSLLLPHETVAVPHAVGPGRAEPEPGPPSSQSASEAQLHVSAHMGGGGGKRGPQSAQSAYSEPGSRGRRRWSQGVGQGVETRPLARPPKGTQKKSLDAAVA